MDIQGVRNRVSHIDSLKDDCQSAHLVEKALYNDVLEHIANGGSDGQALVKEALKAKRIEFPRYTA